MVSRETGNLKPKIIISNTYKSSPDAGHLPLLTVLSPPWDLVGEFPNSEVIGFVELLVQPEYTSIVYSA